MMLMTKTTEGGWWVAESHGSNYCMDERGVSSAQIDGRFGNTHLRIVAAEAILRGSASTQAHESYPISYAFYLVLRR